MKNIDLEDLNITQINKKYQTQLNIFEKIALKELKNTNSLLNLIRTSRNYLAETNSDKCPICQNNIKTSEILPSLDEQASKLENENNHLKNWQVQNRKLITMIEQLHRKLPDHDLCSLMDSLGKLNRLEITTADLDREILTCIEEELYDANRNTAELENTFMAIEILSKISDIESAIEKLEKYFDVSKTVAETYSQKKKEAIENIFEEIRSIVDEFYTFIHYDDEISHPKFRIKSSRGLTVSLLFGADSSNPRSFASEGHIDTLGLCIFLAFVKKFNRYNFIILDDIISTVDLEHKEQIIRLLIEKFSDYTFVITTHNKLWFKQLRRLTKSYNIQYKFSFIDIKGWDRVEGPLITKSSSAKKKIQRYIDEDDAEAAGNAIRKQLESVLGELCRLNRIPMPIFPRYTVNDYYMPFINYFQKIFKNTNIEEYYQSVFAELENMLYIGNLLSHENDEKYDFHMSEIIKYRDAVYAFEDAFKCRNHNKLLKFDKKRKTALCTNEKCQNVFIIEKVKK